MNQDHNGFINQSNYGSANSSSSSNSSTEPPQRNYQYHQPISINSDAFYRSIHQPHLLNQQQQQQAPYQFQQLPIYNQPHYGYSSTSMNTIPPIKSDAENWSTGLVSAKSLLTDPSHSNTKTLNNAAELLQKSATTRSNVKTPARSNKGCLTCRSRKHKCDEVKPVCNECARINMKCIYAPKGFVNMDTVNLDSGSDNTTTLTSKKKVQSNEVFVEGIGAVKILRAKVNRKLVDGKVVYRA